MLAELIKLSKKLLELELVKESSDIDDLIHKLYSVGEATPDDFYKDVCYEEAFDPRLKTSSLEEFRDMIIVNAEDEEFKAGISDALIDSLSLHELEAIKETISDYLE